MMYSIRSTLLHDGTWSPVRSAHGQRRRKLEEVTEACWHWALAALCWNHANEWMVWSSTSKQIVGPFDTEDAARMAAQLL